MKPDWISVNDDLPKCDMTPNSFGVLVEIRPRYLFCDADKPERFAYYGCRQTDKPNFYKYGAVIDGITHWRYPSTTTTIERGV